MTTNEIDAAAIRQVVAEAQEAQNDVDRLMALHTDDTAIVNIAGRRVLGKAAFREAMTGALASPLADVQTAVAVDDVRFPHADVAIASCVKRVHDGREPPVVGNDAPLPATGRLTYVLVRTGDEWRIASAQTTPIATP
ncbi:hypothetical protein BH24ACT6_BH24ACT6_14120 [soil metagenome]